MNLSKKEDFTQLFILLFISVLPLLNLLINTGLPVTHDGLDHVARIASFYQNLQEGIIIPRWAGNLNWGFGHPILMFLYPLPSYSASLVHFLGFSFVNSFKIVFAISYILSGLFMFYWLKQFLSKNAALLGSVLYILAPYRFIDLYVRGAFGEHVAFVFMPLVLLAIIKLSISISKNRKNLISSPFIAFSTAGLILSHNAISLIFFPFIIFYVLYLYFETRSRKFLLITFLSIGWGFLLSLFFWFPAFEEGKYTLRDIVTKKGYVSNFVRAQDLIYGNWNFGNSGSFSVQIGLTQIALSLASIVFFIKHRKYKENLIFWLNILFLFASIIIMLRESSVVWEKISILQKLQFPWRFLSLVVFLTSLTSAIFVSKIKNEKIFVLIFISITILSTLSYWHAKQYKIFSDNFFNRPYPSTTDTGESSPIWSVRFMEDFAKNQVEIIQGKGNIKILSHQNTLHHYLIENSETVRIKENTLYFPGWTVYDNGAKIQNLEFQDPKNRGLITFYLNPGKHDLIVRFEDTKLRKISNIISLLSFMILMPILVLFLTYEKYSK